MVSQRLILSLGAPESCFSDKTCSFSVGANGTSPVIVTQVQLVFRNLATGASVSLFHSFSGGQNINVASGGITVFFDVNFNSLQSQFPAVPLLPKICGGGVGLQVEAVAIETSGTIDVSCDPVALPASCVQTTVELSPCFSTEIRQFASNTQQFFNCIGVDGEVGVQGILVHCGSLLGIGVCQDLVGATVHIGLVDLDTNNFYEYASTNTQAAGFFGIGFGIRNRTDVVALIPPTGSKKFSIAAVFDGDLSNSPSPRVVIPLTIKGPQADPCFLGPVLASTTFPTTVPSGQPIHETITAQTVSGVSIGPAGEFVAADLQATAQKLLTATRDGIVKAGANPIDITVHQGPSVALFMFQGFGLITVPTMTVVAHSWGSPVAVGVIILAIIAALVVLGIVIYFILQIVRDIVKLPGGGPVLETVAIAIAVLAAAGLGVYYLSTRGKKK